MMIVVCPEHKGKFCQVCDGYGWIGVFSGRDTLDETAVSLAVHVASRHTRERAAKQLGISRGKLLRLLSRARQEELPVVEEVPVVVLIPPAGPQTTPSDRALAMMATLGISLPAAKEGET